MRLHDTNKGICKHRRKRRLGRGIGSGRGKTSARGHKGAKSRAGYSRHAAFQGGAMPLVRRVPKRGFHNKFALQIAEINVGDLDRVFAGGDEITPDLLRVRNLVKGRYDELKVLGNGELTKKLKVTAHRFSKSAEEKITQAGGEVVRLPGKAPVIQQKSRRAQAGGRPVGKLQPALGAKGAKAEKLEKPAKAEKPEKPPEAGGAADASQE